MLRNPQKSKVFRKLFYLLGKDYSNSGESNNISLIIHIDAIYISQPKFFPKKVLNSLRYYVELYNITHQFHVSQKNETVCYSSIAKKNFDYQESECH